MGSSNEIQYWNPVKHSPVAGLELRPHARFAIGSRTYHAVDAIDPVRVGGATLSKERGVHVPLLVEAADGLMEFRYLDSRGWVQRIDPATAGTSVLTVALETNPPPAPVAAATATAMPNHPSYQWPKERAKPRGPFPWATLTLLIVTCGLAVAAKCGAATQLGRFGYSLNDQVAKSVVPLFVNGFINTDLPTFGLWIIGLLLFGRMVERNVGSVRTILLILCGSAGGVLGAWLLSTFEGKEVVDRVAYQFFEQVAPRLDPETAITLFFKYQENYFTFAVHGLIGGSAGVCGALIAYACLRRRVGTSELAVRPVKFIVGILYLGLVAVVWKNTIDSPFPVAVFVGGVLIGMAFILPEKAANYVLEYVWDQLTRRKSY